MTRGTKQAVGDDRVLLEMTRSNDVYPLRDIRHTHFKRIAVMLLIQRLLMTHFNGPKIWVNWDLEIHS